MCQAIRRQGLALRDVLPPSDVLHLIMFHPLRVQVSKENAPVHTVMVEDPHISLKLVRDLVIVPSSCELGGEHASAGSRLSWI